MTAPQVYIYDTTRGQLRLDIESRHQAKLSYVDEPTDATSTGNVMTRILSSLVLGEWSIITSADRFIISHQCQLTDGSIEFTRCYPTSGLHKPTGSYFNYSDSAPSGVFILGAGVFHEVPNKETLIEELKLVRTLIIKPTLAVAHALSQAVDVNYPEIYFVQDANLGPTSLSAIQDCLGNEGAAEWLESLITTLTDSLVDVRG